MNKGKGMSKFTPEALRVGTVLLTQTTRRLSQAEWDAHERREKGMVFAHFNHDDAGRGRELVADCWLNGVARHAHEYAKLFAAAPDLLEALADSYVILAGFIADYPDTELAAEARKAQAVNDAALTKARK